MTDELEGITGDGEFDLQYDTFTRVPIDVSGIVAITNNSLTDSRVIIDEADTPVVEDNTSTYNLTIAPSGADDGAAFDLAADDLDFADITGNTASGSGTLGLQVSATVTRHTAYQGGALPLILYGQRDQLHIAVGATATFGAGTMIEAGGSAVIKVEGTLISNGTSQDPVTITSAAQSPAPGDWQGIEGGTLILRDTTIDDATKAVQGYFTLTNDTFAWNDTAVSVSGGGGGRVHSTWFDGNSAAFGGLPTWSDGSSGASCGFAGGVLAGGNTFGTAQSPDAFVSAADYKKITADLAAGDQASPPGWTDDIAPGSTDLVDWSEEPCASGTAPTTEVATPYNLGNNT